MTRTFLSYPGGKMRLATRIVAQIGEHRTYVEPFSGTAAVLFAKPRSPFELIADADSRIVTMLRVVRDQPDALASALALTPYARDEFRSINPEVEWPADDVEIARRVCVRVAQSFALVGMADATKGWRISSSIGTACAATWAKLPEKVMLACERLRGVHIDCIDALSLVERYGRDETAVLYCDPPYLGTTRATGMYAVDMTSDDAHTRLLAALNDCRAHVLLSGYHAPLYATALAGWSSLDIAASANHNGQAGHVSARTETLWSNRELSPM